jgi:CheY-like chemotaxis protein
MTQTDRLTGARPFPIETLMLIDDSTFDQLICKRITTKADLVGNLLQYVDAEKALDYLADPKNPTPDLILLDVNMPKMDGFGFLEAVHKKFGTKLCPIVVMLDPSLDPKGEQRAKDFPMVKGFLKKPLTQDDLHGFANLPRASR